jgi:hypothetical protein
VELLHIGQRDGLHFGELFLARRLILRIALVKG